MEYKECFFPSTYLSPSSSSSQLARKRTRAIDNGSTLYQATWIETQVSPSPISISMSTSQGTNSLRQHPKPPHIMACQHSFTSIDPVDADQPSCEKCNRACEAGVQCKRQDCGFTMCPPCTNFYMPSLAEELQTRAELRGYVEYDSDDRSFSDSEQRWRVLLVVGEFMWFDGILASACVVCASEAMCF